MLKLVPIYEQIEVPDRVVKFRNYIMRLSPLILDVIVSQHIKTEKYFFYVVLNTRNFHDVDANLNKKIREAKRYFGFHPSTPTPTSLKHLKIIDDPGENFLMGDWKSYSRVNRAFPDCFNDQGRFVCKLKNGFIVDDEGNYRFHKGLQTQ
jgi:hypothetical protein